MRRKCKRPLTFLLALLLLFSLTGASVQAEESGNAGTSVQVQTVVMQEDGTQKEDDVGATASTEENVQQEIPEINLTEIQQEEFQNGQNDNVEGEDTLQEKKMLRRIRKKRCRAIVHRMRKIHLQKMQ